MIVNGLLVLMYAVLNSYGALIIKHEINKIEKIDLNSVGSIIEFFVKLAKSPAVITGFVAIFISALAWMAALSRMDVSLAYPAAVGLNFLIVTFVAISLFGEQININKILGILLVFASIYFLSKS
jgi:multidrug transporter EmrE-like cation transporter